MSLTEAKVTMLIDKEVQELFASFETERKEVLLLLQFHLYTEQLIERIIIVYLERGNKLIDSAALSFHQKLCVIEALNAIDQRYVDALRKLNKLRNTCAHVHSAPINRTEIDKIGRCLGKIYSEILREHASTDTLNALMVGLFAKIGSHMISRSIQAEHPT